MAHIKCRYNIPYCCDITRLEWDENSFCSEMAECSVFYQSGYERPKNADPLLMNPVCSHVVWRRGEFEKTVQRYEYTEEGGLVLSKGEHYNPCDIDYLEIDGRTLIKGDEHE